MLDQRAPELIAGVDDDFPVQLLFQLRDLRHHVIARQDGRVAPAGIFEGGGHDVLRQAVQPVRPLASPGCPPRREPLVAPPAQQQGLGAQRLAERDAGPLFEVLAPKLAEPAAEPEALRTVRVLDDSVERDVGADHDLSHVGFPFRWCGQKLLMQAPRPPETGRPPAAQFGPRPASTQDGSATSPERG